MRVGFRSLLRVSVVQVISLLLLLLALVAGFTLPAQASEQPYLNVVELNTINYPTIKVTFEAIGADGLPITGLGRADFAAYENGRQQLVVSGYAVQASSRPLAVMLALDTSLSMADDGKLQQAKDAANAFVAQLRPLDRVALLQFDSNYSVVSQFSSDHAALTQRIGSLTAQGNTRLYDALTLAINATATTVDGSKAVVLMTDGQDTESAADLPQVLNLIHDTGIRVYTIGVGNDIDEGVLSQIAQASGGHFYRAPTAADIGGAFRLMSDQVRDRYELVYGSPATSAQGATVSVRLTAKTPQGVASGQASYLAPAFSRVTRPGFIGPVQPEAVQSTTSPADVRRDYEAIGLAGFGVLLAATGLAVARAQRARQLRLGFFTGGGPGSASASEDGDTSLLAGLLLPLMRLAASLIQRLMRPAKVQQMSRHLTLAGYPFGWRVSHFVVVKCISGVLGALVGLLYALHSGQPMRGMLLVAGLALLGYRIPTFWIKRRIKARQDNILKALPDALDLLTVCVEAGLGLDGAMLEVINKWDNPLSDEFAIVLAELKMGRSRREALRALAERTGVQDVSIFTSAMIQADELGMAVARPLALQADQLRLKRRQRAEKKAHEAGTKIVVAMGLFIMPALFLVILSPAVIQMKGLFH